jgi:hypothetical protein
MPTNPPATPGTPPAPKVYQSVQRKAIANYGNAAKASIQAALGDPTLMAVLTPAGYTTAVLNIGLGYATALIAAYGERQQSIGDMESGQGSFDTATDAARED